MQATESSTPFITNSEIARVLFQNAALLEMFEANQFRVSAYRRAALGVLFLPKPFVEYVMADEEAPLPGVGERMRGKLVELANTGHIDSHDALVEEIGEPMLSLLQLQGIGPKTATRLIAELQIRSLRDLADAARDGRIQALRGFGPKREEQLGRRAENALQTAA
ncbi:MAG TPA: helix-hairpin-helix domain-containing protein [Chloroflexota bacterium]